MVFIGSVRDDKGKYTSSVYLFKPEDNRITKIIEGLYDKNYYLQEPQWSDDESMLTIPFYYLGEEEYPIHIYDVGREKLDVLPVKGMTPSISPDKNKIAYINKDKVLSIFNLQNETVTTMPKDIKGFNPIWFSDNTRILLYTLTGRNPGNLEGAEFQDICIVDTVKPQDKKLLGFETVYRGCKWIKRDELVWIVSGWDDGYCEGLLDLNTFRLNNFGDGVYNYYQKNDDDIYFIIDDQPAGYQLLTHNMDKVGTFTVEEYKRNWQSYVLSLLSDRRLLYLKRSFSEMKAEIILSFLNENNYVKLIDYEGWYIPIVSQDGSKIALVDNGNSDNFIIIDAMELGSD